MLAAGSAASAPQGARAEVQPVTRNTAHSALSIQMQKQQLENMGLQNRLLDEQINKTKADTEVSLSTAMQLNYSMIESEHRSMLLAQQIKRAITELDITDEQLRTARLSNAQLEKLQPLLEEYQRLRNQAERLGMSQRQVDAKFAEELGEESKYFRFIQQIFGTPRGDVR